MAKKRVLLFVFDGTGLGHLRRMARIAECLQRHFVVLVVTGMREASWIVPDNCEVMILPSLTSMIPTQASLLQKQLWLELDVDEVMAMRRGFLRAVMRHFAPSAFLTDYLPFGRRRELFAILSEERCVKYFIHRGIADASDGHFLSGTATGEIASVFDRICITADKRVGDVLEHDQWTLEARAKATYVGYVRPPGATREHGRAGLLRRSNAPWIVCSNGGGWRGERFIESLVEVARDFPLAQFDVVCGPLSRLDAAALTPPNNCRVWETRHDLPAMHAAADIVITHGGYNSLMEAMSGGARLIVVPSRTGADNEQAVNGARFGVHYPIALVNDASALRARVSEALSDLRTETRPTWNLDNDGANTICRLLQEDLDPDRPVHET